MKKLIRSRPHLGGECRSKPIVPYYRDQKGELNGQKETTLPMRKLIRSGTLLGGGAPIYFLLNGSQTPERRECPLTVEGGSFFLSCIN